MPKVPKLEKLFVKPMNQWSPFPKRPLPFRMADWQTKKYDKFARVTKIRNPSTIREVTPYKEWPIVRGDLVEVMVGKDKGKQGKVRAVARRKNQVKVIGMNTSEHFVSDLGDGAPGFMLIEEPIHYSDIKLVDPWTGKTTETKMKFDADGNRVRVCTESGRIIPKPPYERLDFKTRSAVKEGEFDTKDEAVQNYTYMPSLLLFHEEIMKEMNIPMTVPKTDLERRDQIFLELEREALAEREQKDIASKQIQQNESVMDKLKNAASSLMFWKK